MKSLILTLLFLSQILVGKSFNQQVHYKIDAELIPQTKTLKVKSNMFYQNNSPDTLKEIYVHIYWNLYSKQSYARKLAEKLKDYYSQETRDVEIKKVILYQKNKSQFDLYELDNTIMRIPLIEPLSPNESIQLEIELDEEIPPEGLRMGYYKRYFSIANWFPSVCVYDNYGWHKDQYLGTGEFYEEISDFEVNLTLPESFLVFYTGELLNSQEIYSKAILEKLEEAKKSEKAVRIFELSEKVQINDEKKKTWKFKANNVRTFAFACFEDYIWDASSVDGVLVHVVYPKQLEKFYTEEGMKAAQHAIKFFSEKIGPYVYPQMFVTVGGSTGGMEYPGIVFMGRGQSGGLMAYYTASVIIHEIGHNWFPMMLNTNEIEFAFMDEGFNTFFTNLAVEELYGRKNNRFKLEGLLSNLVSNSDVRTSDYADVINYLKSGYTEPIITHSDRYEKTIAYVVNAYPRTSMKLFMLWYLMGDKAFDELWREYYQRFLFRKIYPEDFFKLAEEIYQKYHGRNSLIWFFDQWFYKDYMLDFSLEEFNVELHDDYYLTTIKICNKERALMPCDVEVKFEDGTTEKVYFSMDDFSKGIQSASKTIKFRKKPIFAEIDPDKFLLDVNRLNNTSDFLSSLSFKLKPVLDISPNPFDYQIFYSPYFWFNNYDGLKLGLNLEGNYLFDEKIFELSLFKGLRRGIQSFGGEIKISDKLNFFGPLSHGTLRFFNYEGRRGFQAIMSKTFARYAGRNPQIKINLAANYFDAYDDIYFDKNKFDRTTTYTNVLGVSINDISQRQFLFTSGELVYTNNWELFKTRFSVYYEAGIVKEIEKNFQVQSNNILQISSSWQNRLYQKISFTFIQDFRPKSIFTYLKFRQFIGATPRKLPKAREFYLATVNPIDEFGIPLYRTYGFFSKNFITNHSIPNGDGMMRGYYKNNISDDLITTFNAELNLTKSFSYFGLPGKIISFFNPKFFFDVGNVWANEKEFKIKALKSDWGITISLIPQIDDRLTAQLKRINPFTKIGIDDFRIDFPIYVSHPPIGENKFEFRWLLGLRSTF